MYRKMIVPTLVMIVVVRPIIGVTISKSGGYENLVIKLSQDLEQQQCSTAISSLKVCIIVSSYSTFYIFPGVLLKHSSITIVFIIHFSSVYLLLISFYSKSLIYTMKTISQYIELLSSPKSKS